MTTSWNVRPTSAIRSCFSDSRKTGARIMRSLLCGASCCSIF